MPEARVSGLFITPYHRGKSRPLSEASAIEGGLEGDYHVRPASSRQILLLAHGILREFQIEPGDLRENITIDGVDVTELKRGQRLRVGAAVLEITTACEPCVQVDRLKPGLKDAIAGRRGMFARVVDPGAIRIGDDVQLL